MLKDKFLQIKRKWVDGILLQGWRFSTPPNIIIETTNMCSLRCTCCPNGVTQYKLRERGCMSIDTFNTFLQHMDIPIKQCFLHMCGEPFLNKNLYYFAEQLLAHNITPIIFSNGYRIDYTLLEKLLSLKGIHIAFSMDLLSPKHYEQIRIPSKFEMAEKELTNINSIFSKKKRFYGLNIIMNPTTVLELENNCRTLFDKYSNLNKIFLSSMWPWPNLPQTGDIAGHITKNGRLCKRIKELPAILWNGDVTFCSFDYSGDLIVGNIKNHFYSSIFNGEKTRKIRRSLLTGNKDKVVFCKNCLLPQYESYNGILLRNHYYKMDAEKRKAFFQNIKHYYEI